MPEQESADAGDDKCRVITEVAMQKAMNKCGSEEEVKKQLRRIVGLDDGQDEEDCDAVLESGLDTRTLANTRETREWVMCRGWEIVRDDNETLSAAIERAWAEARAAGEERGFEV